MSRPVFKPVFKPSSRPSSSRLQDRLQAVFKTLPGRLGELAAELAPRHSELQNCGFQEVYFAAVTPLLFQLASDSVNSHNLLAAACGDPEIAFANSESFRVRLRGPLKKCTNRRPFKLAMTHNFLNFPRSLSADSFKKLPSPGRSTLGRCRLARAAQLGPGAGPVCRTSVRFDTN